MNKPKRYNILIFSDEHGSHRQMSISKVTIVSLISLVALLVVGSALATTLLFKKKPQESEKVVALKEEIEALKLANDRYLNATLVIEKKLKQFEEKTNKLASYVGVDTRPLEVGGIGGAELLENELSQYLRYDLNLLENKTNLLDQQVADLADAFEEHKDVLDSTPSIFPARGWISSGMGYRKDPFTGKRSWHNGIDISNPAEGTPIYAPANGVVSFRGYKGGAGNLIVLNHGNQILTKYAHLSRFNVSKGQRVKRGDLIGYMGATGSRATGPHLHFEIHKDGKPINPLKFIVDEIKPF